MNTWTLETEESRELLLNQAEQVAKQALTQYDIKVSNVTFLNISDAITYKVESEPSDVYLLRMNNKCNGSKMIETEIHLLSHIREQKIVTPIGVKTKSGDYVQTASLDIINETIEVHISLMTWLEGQDFDHAPTEQQITQAGALLANLHNTMASFDVSCDAFDEIGIKSFAESMNKLYKYHSNFLKKEEWDIYQQASHKINEELESYEVNQANVGIIHGDYHWGNLIHNHDQVYPIDFGRCSIGPYSYDLATALLGLGKANRSVFLDAYLRVRELDVNYIQQITTMFVMVMIDNYAHHSSNPEEFAGLIEEQEIAIQYLNAYLKDELTLF